MLNCPIITRSRLFLIMIIINNNSSKKTAKTVLIDNLNIRQLSRADRKHESYELNFVVVV